MHSGYIVTSDCTWFTASANAYQKLRLVTQTFQGKVFVPQGCQSWVHDEFQDSIVQYSWPHCLVKRIVGKITLAFQYWWAFWSLRRQVDRWFVAPSNEMSFLACWIAECFSRKPFVLFCWDPPGVSVRDRQDVFSKLRCRLMDFLMGHAVLHSEQMILNLHPDFLSGRFTAKERQKVVTFPNGTLVDVNAANVHGVEKVLHRIAVNSKFEAAKGCFEMAQLFVAIRKRITDASMVWTGDGCDREKVLRMLREAGIPDNAIIAPGRIPQREAMRMLATAQLAVNSYEDVPSLRWNYVLKIPEFQSIGVPVVSVDLPGAREYIKDGVNGLLITTKRLIESQDRIVNLLNDADHCQNLAKSAFESVRDYDWMIINSSIAKTITNRGI